MGVDGFSKQLPGTAGAGRPDGRAVRVGPPDGPVLSGAAVAKLGRPRTPPAFVARPRLFRLLDGGTRRPVTLISAGAGWGKTALAASWAETVTPPAAVGWLGLDAENDRPDTFWSSVLAAIRRTGMAPDDDLVRGVNKGPATRRAPVERIAVALGRLSGPVILVLDELDAVVDPRILRDLGALLRHQPERLRLVLIARQDPPLPLHRLRTAGWLTEIRAPNLGFTMAEAAELLVGHGLQLADTELRTLLDRTEGWAAGLRLAASYLTARGDQYATARFTGDRGAVADYLMGEVLAHQPPAVRRFLIHTSIVDRLSGDLADAMVAGAHSQAMLERLERANAFVVGHGASPGWFRYHPLLRDLLRHLLQVEEPGMAPELHLRAARWYARHNAPLKAVTHAAAAGDWPLVGRLVVAGFVPFILSADRDALANVLREVPPDQFPRTAELKICAALLLFNARDYGGIPRQVADARLLLEHLGSTGRRPVEIALRSLELAVARARGDTTALIAAATDVLGLLAEVRLEELPSALQYRAIAVDNKGVGLLWNGDLDRADQYLRTALMGARAARLDLVEINATGHLAVIEFLRGSLREARKLASAAGELARTRGLTGSLQAVAAHTALTMVEVESNNLAEAEQTLKHGFDAHRCDPELAQGVALRVAQVRLLLARGSPAAAEVVLGQTWQEVDAATLAPVLLRWLTLAQAEIDLAAGRGRPQARTGPECVDEALAQRERVSLARADLAAGDIERADARLASVRDAPTDLVAAVEAWVVTALLADRQGRAVRSADALVRAVAIAEREGIRRPFSGIDRSRTADLIERQRWLAPDSSAFVAGVLGELRPGGGRPGAQSPAAELSTREMEVLRYLPTMFNAGEIAEELHVSVNTVKAHLRSIYRKLEVSRRREAVVRARGLGLLG
ncbi:MAG TPA: LuxR C-terminal-related transcriptional regulator [Pilimelia sp.]|nr:LuxR C-terminal-related transcriptional regulator [Pilimelia sp.]